MSDIISTAPVVIRRPRLQLRLPRFGLCLALGKLLDAYGQAATMAYVDPFRASGTPARALPDEDLEGRDPKW